MKPLRGNLEILTVYPGLPLRGNPGERGATTIPTLKGFHTRLGKYAIEFGDPVGNSIAGL